MSKNIVKGNIGNALHDVSPDHIVATADEIFDEQRQQYQETINERVGDYVENPEFVEVSVDSSNHVLYGVQEDGNFYFGAGVPNQIQTELDSLSDKIDVDVSTAINELREEIDGSINTRIQELEDITDEKFANIDSSLNDLGFYTDNPEFVRVNIDASNKVLYGVQNDGNFYFGAGVPNQVTGYVEGELSKRDASISKIEHRYFDVNEYYGTVGINYTLEEAIALVPEEYQHGGLILSFNSEDLYQLDSSIFEYNKNNWSILLKGKYTDDSEFIDVKLDSSNHLLESRDINGIKKEYVGFETPYIVTNNVSTNDVSTNNLNVQTYNIDGNLTYIIDNPEFIEAKIDSSGRFIEGINRNGEKIFGVIPPQIKQYIDENIPIGGSGVQSIEYDEITGDMYATYDSSGGVTDVNMESNGDIYVEYEE